MAEKASRKCLLVVGLCTVVHCGGTPNGDLKGRTSNDDGPIAGASSTGGTTSEATSAGASTTGGATNEAPSAGASSGGTAAAAGAPSRRICDGSGEVRLAFRAFSTSLVEAYTAVLHELGWRFLYVDGRCDYWIQDPGLPSGGDQYPQWRSYRVGRLSDAQEVALHDMVSYDNPDGFPKCEVIPGTFDVSLMQFWDGLSVRTCPGQLLGTDWNWPMRDELFRQAVVMNGPMRIEVGALNAVDVPFNTNLYPWPLSTGPESYVTPVMDSLSPGQSKLIEDPVETAAIRTVRDQFLVDAETSPRRYFGIIYVDSQRFSFAVRDDLPFTDRTTGLWEPK